MRLWTRNAKTVATFKDITGSSSSTTDSNGGKIIINIWHHLPLTVMVLCVSLSYYWNKIDIIIKKNYFKFLASFTSDSN